MEVPGDMKVNGQPFVHISASEGSMELHADLLAFYAKHVLVNRVILNIEDTDFVALHLAATLKNKDIEGLDHVFIMGKDEEVTDVTFTED